MTAKPVVVCGLGPIGIKVAELALAPGGPGVAALVDVDPAAVQALPAELEDRPAHLELEAALREFPGHPVLLCTTSAFDSIAPDLESAAAAGSSVLTSCEEALWPFVRWPERSRAIDDKARAAGITIVGLGINPGYLMDHLPAVLAAPFGPPQKIRVERRVDVGTRRGPLQAKVGVGMTVEQFEEQKRGEGIGHRGLEESIYLLGAALGIEWDEVVSDVEPVIADRDHDPSTNVLGVAVPTGGVVGMHNHGRGVHGGQVRAELDLVMALNLREPLDRTLLLGDPPFPIRWEAPGGIPGDEGTARVMLHALPRLEGAPAGLRTVLDLPGAIRGSLR